MPLSDAEIDQIARSRLGLQTSLPASGTVSGVAPGALSDVEIDKEARARLAGGSALGAIGSGIASGFERAAAGIGQLGAKLGVPIAGPEDVNTPPVSPEALATAPQRLAERVQQREAETAPVRQAHPWLFGAGNVMGSMAATSPLLAMAPTSLPGFGLVGALSGVAEPVPTNQLSNFLGSKLKQAETGVAYGLLGGSLLKYLPGALSQAYNFPKQLVNVAQTRAMATPYAQRGLEVAQQTGMDLSPAMVSGSRVATQAENLARQSMWSSDKALESYQKLSRQAVDHSNSLISDWTAGRGAPDAATLGQQLRDTTRQAVSTIQDRASQQWNQDMAAVTKASPPGFNFDETKTALQKVIAENDQNLTDAGIALKNQASTLLDRITAAEQGPVSLDSAIALRRQFGKAAKGTGNLFTDIHPTEQRRLAGQLFGALNGDFESAANDATGQLGEAFRQANSNYRKAMGSIDYIEKSVLGKTLGKDIADSLYSGNLANTAGAPERLVGQITRLSPSSLEQARTILEQNNPALLQDLKAYTLQQAIDKGQMLAPSMGTRLTFDPAKAATALLTPQQRAALYTPQEIQSINAFDEGLRRWADRHGYNFSGTAPAQEFLHWVNRLGMGVLGLGTAAGSVVAGGPVGLLGAAAAGKGAANYVFGARQIADAMLNPGDRTQLLTLLKLPDGAPLTTQIASYLMARYGLQENPDNSKNSGNAGNQQTGQ